MKVEFTEWCRRHGMNIPENPELTATLIRRLAFGELTEAYIAGTVLSWEQEADDYLIQLLDGTLNRLEACHVRVPKINSFGISERDLSVAAESHKFCAVYGSCAWDGFRLDIVPSILLFCSAS
jgi:hypothetical protein